MTLSFGPCTLDFATRQLRRDGREVHLSPKAFELLGILVRARPAVIAKAELQRRLWPDTFVADANLPNLIGEIRAALGDDVRTPQYLRTVHKFGYAFSGSVTAAPDPAAPAGTGWLEWGVKRFLLPPGEHLIGREAGVEVCLDASTVSRRHARLLVTADGTILEDFGSKNGTFHRGHRVTAPVALANGDCLRFGSEETVFRTGDPETTATQTATSA